jgi:hypothetical protein
MMQMDNKTYKSVIWNRIGSIILASVVIYLAFTFVFGSFLGMIYNKGLFIMLSLAGSVIWEITHSVSVTVRRDGVCYTKYNKPEVLYKFDIFNFSSVSGINVLRAENRVTKKVDELACTVISKDKFKEMIDLIKKRQSRYFDERNIAVNAVRDIDKKASTDNAKIKTSSEHFDDAMTQPVTEKPEPSVKKTAPHDHGDDFTKTVFYYPKRAVIDSTERSNVLFVLITLVFYYL